MNYSKYKEEFDSNGYVVRNDLVSIEKLIQFQNVFFRLLQRICIENNLQQCIPTDLPDVKDSCNTILQAIINHAPDALVKLQRLVSRLPEFYDLASSHKLSCFLKDCLNKDKYSPLYTISNLIVFGLPEFTNIHSTSNFHTPWHTDIYWTIPDSNYVHLWMPVLNPVTPRIGPLEICCGSHKMMKNHPYYYKKDAPYNYRYGINEKYVKQFKKKFIQVNLGEILIFHRGLIHRSGSNQTNNKTRMTMIGLFHDAENSACVPGTPSLKFNGKTPEESYYEKFNDESVKPFLHDQLDISDIPPTGI